MKSFVRLAIVIAGFFIVHNVIAQVISATPSYSTNSSERERALRAAAEQAKQTALTQMRQIGGQAARLADRLQLLEAHKFLERLAVRPVAGPSTIAAPPAAQSGPSPTVNWTEGGGPTTGNPGVALLLARRPGDSEYVPRCTGTLVSQNVILTAAHCICYSKRPDEHYATGNVCVNGNSDRPPSPLNDPRNWRVFFQHAGIREVVRVITNNEYRFDDRGVRSDLALLVLSEPVRDITPAQLPMSAARAAPWQKGEITGFGYSSIRPDGMSTRGATVLSALTVPGLKSRGEVNASGCDGYAYLDAAGSLCSLFAPGQGGSTSTVCSGDSGGPLRLLDTSGTTIGVTSGRSDPNCTSSGTVEFQMATSYTVHRTWIERNLNTVAVATITGRWPAFGENFRDVVDRRNAVPFAKDGSYLSEGWMTDTSGHKVLATINSSGIIRSFEVQDRQGTRLCRGQAGVEAHMSQVDYCIANIPLGTQYRIVATGNPSELLQYVVTAQSAR